MQTRSSVLAILLFAFLAGTVGCISRRTCCAPPELSRPSGLVPTGPASDERAVLDTDLLKSIAERLRTTNYEGPPPNKPMKVLALSGGGMYGAYSVGVLAGWTAAGNRPEFDVVTGVSTGALVGTFAFLGTAQDKRMVELYTTITDRDIFRRKIPGAALWSDSVASSAPLRCLIEAQVDDAVIAGVAQAHACGRRLYVGTTNINTRRLVIWDMGAIASSGRPDSRELFQKILLASASLPGFLPPVEIDITINGQRYTELHMDGGATSGLFLRASALNIDANAAKSGHPPLAGSDAYIIVAGKLYADPKCTDRLALKLGESSLHSLIYSQTRSELFRIYALCLLGGMGFHLAAIPEDMKIGTDAMGFDRDEMRRLYEAGYKAATAGLAWRDTPPGAEPHEQTKPRSGKELLAPGR